MLRVDISERNITAGQELWLSVLSDSRAEVQIACFTSHPPPPTFRECPECGIIVIPPAMMRRISITASLATFADRGGQLHIRVVNARGETRELKVRVTAAESESSSGSPLPA